MPPFCSISGRSGLQQSPRFPHMHLLPSFPRSLSGPIDHGGPLASRLALSHLSLVRHLLRVARGRPGAHSRDPDKPLVYSVSRRRNARAAASPGHHDQRESRRHTEPRNTGCQLRALSSKDPAPSGCLSVLTRDGSPTSCGQNVRLLRYDKPYLLVKTA
jgi:hypothetical protein